MYNLIKSFSQYVLNETLLTHDIDMTIRNINIELSLQNYNVQLSKNKNNTIYVCINNFNYIQNQEILIDYINNLLIDRHGWFPSKMILTNIIEKEQTYAYNNEYLLSIGRKVSN